MASTTSSSCSLHYLGLLAEFLFLPFILTFVFFWLMPVVSRFFYRKHIRNKIKLERIKADETAASVRAESEILKAEVEKAKVKEEAGIISPGILWREEYEKFREHPLFDKFKEVIDCVYSYEGKINYHEYESEIQDWITFNLSQEMLIYADVNGLINRNVNTITLTEKGKEFVRYYTNEK